MFGATGFTGKLVVEYIIEQYGLKNNKLFKWAIAFILVLIILIILFAMFNPSEIDIYTLLQRSERI